MELTTKKLITLLPLGQELKNKLLAEWESLDPGTRYEMERLIWDTYYALYQIKLQTNLQMEFQKAKEGKAAFDEGFYRRVREETEKEMEKEQAETETDNELTSVRAKLQTLLGK